jgi:hypothetical protein
MSAMPPPLKSTAGRRAGRPACVTVKVCPPIVTVPTRAEVLVFAATA